MKPAKTKASATELRENERKWGKALLAPGWTLVPNILLTKQHALGLDPVDINILLQIMKHWWRADEAPFPSHGKLAETMNIDISTVKRHLKGLRAAGLITWKSRKRPDGGRASNVYDLSGLIKHALPFAEEEMEERQEKVAVRKRRQARKKAQPKLRVVRNDEGGGDV